MRLTSHFEGVLPTCDLQSFFLDFWFFLPKCLLSVSVVYDNINNFQWNISCGNRRNVNSVSFLQSRLWRLFLYFRGFFHIFFSHFSKFWRTASWRGFDVELKFLNIWNFWKSLGKKWSCETIFFRWSADVWWTIPVIRLVAGCLLFESKTRAGYYGQPFFDLKNIVKNVKLAEILKSRYIPIGRQIQQLLSPTREYISLAVLGSSFFRQLKDPSRAYVDRSPPPKIGRFFCMMRILHTGGSILAQFYVWWVNFILILRVMGQFWSIFVYGPPPPGRWEGACPRMVESLAKLFKQFFFISSPFVLLLLFKKILPGKSKKIFLPWTDLISDFCLPHSPLLFSAIAKQQTESF